MKKYIVLAAVYILSFSAHAAQKLDKETMLYNANNWQSFNEYFETAPLSEAEVTLEKIDFPRLTNSRKTTQTSDQTPEYKAREAQCYAFGALVQAQKRIANRYKAENNEEKCKIFMLKQAETMIEELNAQIRAWDILAPTPAYLKEVLTARYTWISNTFRLGGNDEKAQDYDTKLNNVYKMQWVKGLGITFG